MPSWEENLTPDQRRALNTLEWVSARLRRAQKQLTDEKEREMFGEHLGNIEFAIAFLANEFFSKKPTGAAAKGEA